MRGPSLEEAKAEAEAEAFPCGQLGRSPGTTSSSASSAALERNAAPSRWSPSILRASKWLLRPVKAPLGAKAVGGANPGKALVGGASGVDPKRPNPAAAAGV